MSDRDAVLFANEAFYRAFGDRDIAAMERLWAADAPICCVHPGWAPLEGRDAVIASWRGILANPAAPRIRSHRPSVWLHGDVAFVMCFEQVERAWLVATNVFVREAGGWKMAHHHAGPASQGPRLGETEGPTSRAVH